MSSNFKTVITVALMLSASLIVTPTAAGSKTPDRFVGTYYTDGGAMVTINSNGTMEHVIEDMFTRNERRGTPALGVWEKSGKNEIRVTWVRFLTERFSDNFYPDGSIAKLSYRMQFDEPVNGIYPGYIVEGVFIEYFQPGQNPVIDEPTRSILVPSLSSGYRLEVQ